MENKRPFYIVFEVLKVFRIKIYKIQPAILSFLLVLLLLVNNQEISFFTNFYNFIQHYLKKDFCLKFSFSNGFSETPHSVNGQNTLSKTIFFVDAPLHTTIFADVAVPSKPNMCKPKYTLS